MTAAFQARSLPDPDAALVERCQAGGPDAERCFAELVERHEAAIHRRATRILGGEAEADDVVQEVFVNVHRFIGRYRPERPFRHWLSVVTLNTCRLELRRRNGRDRRHEAYRSDPRSERSSQIEIDPILRGWLEHAFHELGEKTQRCIALRVLEGRTYREIAEHESCSVPAVKMRVARGLKNLRDRFERDTETGASNPGWQKRPRRGPINVPGTLPA